MSALEFPGGTLLFDVTKFLFPTWGQAVFSAALIDKKKIEMSFDVGWNCSPALFVAMNSLQRHSKKFCQHFLSFPKFFPG